MLRTSRKSALSAPTILAGNVGQNFAALRGRRVQGEQTNGSSLSMCLLRNSVAHCSHHSPHCQVPFVLPHAPPLRHLQKGLSLVQKLDFIVKSRSLLLFHFIKSSPYCKCVESNCYGSGSESDGGEDGCSGVDLDEVERVCKVIDETFALDRNIEAVLNECGVGLSRELVLCVLRRFRHARKPALRFFHWAGGRPGFDHDSRTYNAMMGVLGRTRQFETMVSFLEEMGEKGLLTMETFTICIRAFAAAKERKKAVGIVDLMRKYKFEVDVETINCLLDALGREKLAREAQLLFEKLEHRFTPDLSTYSILLSGWCRVKNLMEAGRIWNGMIDNGLKPDILAHNTMLEGLLRCNKKSDAIKLFEVMKAKGPLPNVRSYAILIRYLCKHSDMDEALEYFDDMVDCGCEPDVVLYTCLMTSFANQKKMDVVYKILNEMKEKGVPPDGRTYNALIKMMTSRHMPDDAVKIYKKMIQSGFEPTIHTYNMMMKAFFVVRDYEMGCAVWEEMKKKGCSPDENSYTVLIGGLIRQRRSMEACRYLEEMMDKGMRVPQLDFNRFKADFSRAGRLGVAEELAQKMTCLGKY